MRKRFFVLALILAAASLASCVYMDDGAVCTDEPLRYPSAEPSDKSLICPPAEAVVHPAWQINGLMKGVYNGEYVLEYGPHFRIFQTTDLPRWYIHYEVFNQRGEIVRSFTATRTAWIEYISDNVLEIGISAGTEVRMVQFYSVLDDKLSDVFDTPFVITDERIGYLRWRDDSLVLVVRDIFDAQVYYKEFSIEYLARTSSPIHDIKYLGDGTIKVEYWARIGEGFYEKSIVLPL